MDFSWTDLSDAILNLADFGEADLSWANLSRANLNEANLFGSRIGGTNFANVDLSRVKGLEGIIHGGPSSIGMDTIIKSAGNIPVDFLKGCGLSNLQMAAFKLFAPTVDGSEANRIFYGEIFPNIVKGAIHGIHVFISYSHLDQRFAENLYSSLQECGIRCWYAPHDMPIGARIHEEIDRAISRHQIVILILSKNAVRSHWVEKEVLTATEYESNSGWMYLMPIRLDDSIMEVDFGWAADIRRKRHIGDFRKWNDKKAYQKAFEALLRDLKTISEEQDGE